MTKKKSPKYVFPANLSDRLLYAGRRFKVFRNDDFACVGGAYEFVIWDGLYDAELASGSCSPKGVFSGELSFSHVHIEIQSTKTIRDFVQNAKKAQMQFFKDSGL